MCGVGSRQVLITYRFPIGSTAYVCISASTQGKLVPVLISSVSAIKNTGLTYPGPNSYFVTYNGEFYEEDLCSEAQAQNLAIIYLTAQKDLLLSNIQTCCN
jgi:hypothetical protein